MAQLLEKQRGPSTLPSINGSLLTRSASPGILAPFHIAGLILKDSQPRQSHQGFPLGTQSPPNRGQMGTKRLGSKQKRHPMVAGGVKRSSSRKSDAWGCVLLRPGQELQAGFCRRSDSSPFAASSVVLVFLRGNELR